MQKSDIEFTQEDFKNKSLFIATPCYGGMASIEYMTSLCNLINFFSIYKIEYYLGFIGKESLITRARNTLVAQFMASKFSHLIFIDADQEFDPRDVVRMLHYDKDVLSAACPLKCIPPQYALSLISTDPIDGKFVEAYNAGTGFMMIKREVFEKMFEAYPELKYTLDKRTINVSNIKENLADYAYTLFDTQTEELPNGMRVYLSEDYAFCRRWQNISGKVLIDPDIKINHIGPHVFEAQDVNKIINDTREAKKLDN